MYTTCMFCKRPLGSNEVVESFPVGRRLAFDAAKGRLWVVCRKCGRWNLTPLEERWEAVEDCERIFRETRTRASTENIAHRVAAAVVPHLNGSGGSRGTVRHAVREIEASGHPGRFLTDLANLEHSNWTGSMGYVHNMPGPTRLALEMSLHEDRERRALEGELWILEQAWKEAEEIAAISDDLLLPARTDEFFDRHGGGS